MSDWIEVASTYGDWLEANNGDDPPWLSPGMLVEVQGKKPILIGHVNRNNGGCSCCGGIHPRDYVLRYRRVWAAENQGQ